MTIEYMTIQHMTIQHMTIQHMTAVRQEITAGAGDILTAARKLLPSKPCTIHVGCDHVTCGPPQGLHVFAGTKAKLTKILEKHDESSRLIEVIYDSTTFILCRI